MANGTDREALERDTIDQIMDIVELSNKEGPKAIARAEAITATTDEATKLIAVQGDLQANVNQQANRAKLESQRITQDLFAAAGGTERLIELSEDKFNNEKAAEAIQDKIIQESKTGIGDGIIDWLGSQFRISDLEARRDAHINKANRAAGNIQSITNRTTSIAQATALTANTLTDATVKDMAEIDRTTATIKARQAELDALTTNATAVSAVMQMTGAAVDGMTRVLSIQNEKDRMLMAKESHALAVKRANITFEQYATDKAARADFAKLVQDSQAALNLPPMTPSQIDGVMQAGGESANQLRTLVASGVAMTGAIGKSPAEAYDIQATANPNAVPEPLLAAASQAVDIVKTKHGGVLPTGTKGKEIITQQMNQTVSDLYAGFEAEIKEGDASNPNTAPPADVVTGSTAVKETPFWEKLLKNIDPVEINSTQMTELTAEAVKKGTLDVNEAVDGIATYYKQAMLINNTQQKRRMYHLPYQKGYNVKFKDVRAIPAAAFRTTTAAAFGGLFGDKFLTVDMADEVSVRNYIVKLISASANINATAP
jgi:hypothetical protein